MLRRMIRISALTQSTVTTSVGRVPTLVFAAESLSTTNITGDAAERVGSLLMPSFWRIAGLERVGVCCCVDAEADNALLSRVCSGQQMSGSRAASLSAVVAESQFPRHCTKLPGHFPDATSAHTREGMCMQTPDEPSRQAWHVAGTGAWAVQRTNPSGQVPVSPPPEEPEGGGAQQKPGRLFACLPATSAPNASSAFFETSLHGPLEPYEHLVQSSSACVPALLLGLLTVLTAGLGIIFVGWFLPPGVLLSVASAHICIFFAPLHRATHGFV